MNPPERLIFATHNQHKLHEVSQTFKESGIELISLNELSYHSEIKETGYTLEENALIKARHISNIFGGNVFAEDTGLEIEALKGEPGVFSARYAGPEKSAEKNMALVLRKLGESSNRSARFRAVIALVYRGKEYLFSGAVHGAILKVPRGNHGFGYDPIFKPEGYNQSFAELGEAIKLQLSHRYRAVLKMLDFFRTYT